MLIFAYIYRVDIQRQECLMAKVCNKYLTNFSEVSKAQIWQNDKKSNVSRYKKRKRKTKENSWIVLSHRDTFIFPLKHNTCYVGNLHPCRKS